MLKILSILCLIMACNKAPTTHLIKHNNKIGGLSGLFYKDKTLYAVTDRGPNSPKMDVDGDGIEDRTFYVPKYVPLVVKFAQDLKSIKTIIPLKLKGRGATGLPNLSDLDESAFDQKKNKLPFDPYGIDPEGIAIDDQNHIWLCEEYGPSLVEFDEKGYFIRRILPIGSKRLGEKRLPEFLDKRRKNRGFEGITFYNGKLYFVLQSPLFKNSRENYLLSFDPKTNESQYYIYRMHKKGKKLGAITHLKENEFLVLEQNGKTGDKSWQRIYKITLQGPEKEVKKKKFLKLNLSEYEKIEGLSLIDKSLFIIEDNDFAPLKDGSEGLTRLFEYNL